MLHEITTFNHFELSKIAANYGISKINKYGVEISTKERGRWKFYPTQRIDPDATIKYVIYKYNDGFRWRRFVPTYWGTTNQYQLHRNSHTGEWPAFKTIGEAIIYMNEYLFKVSAC